MYKHVVMVLSVDLHGDAWSHYLQEGQSALHLASEGGHTQTVAVLLEKGAQLNLQDRVR